MANLDKQKKKTKSNLWEANLYWFKDCEQSSNVVRSTWKIVNNELGENNFEQFSHFDGKWLESLTF